MTFTVSGVVSDETLSRIIDIESAGRPDAKAKTSSATGLAQFINSTWLATLRQHRPDLFNGPPYDDELALRTDPRLSIELLARLTEANAAALGPDCTDGDLYLAHFAGLATARKVILAQPDTPAGTVFSAAQIKANRAILEGKTCGEVRAWAARKMARARSDWLEVFWPRSEPPQVPPSPQTAPEPRRQPDDPGPDPVPDDDPAPKPGLWQRLKRWLGWGTGAAGSGGVLTYFTSVEFLIVAAITVVVLILIAFTIALWLFGKERVRDFISRVASRWFL